MSLRSVARDHLFKCALAFGLGPWLATCGLNDVRLGDGSGLRKDAGACAEMDCGPIPPISPSACDVGSPDSVCVRAEGGVCRWSVQCSAPEACVETDCGPLQPFDPEVCDGGSVESVCTRADGACRWSIQCGPALEACVETDCGPIPPFDPLVCDGGLVMPACERTDAGTCRWNPCAPP